MLVSKAGADRAVVLATYADELALAFFADDVEDKARPQQRDAMHVAGPIGTRLGGREIAHQDASFGAMTDVCVAASEESSGGDAFTGERILGEQRIEEERARDICKEPGPGPLICTPFCRQARAGAVERRWGHLPQPICACRHRRPAFFHGDARL